MINPVRRRGNENDQKLLQTKRYILHESNLLSYIFVRWSNLSGPNRTPYSTIRNCWSDRRSSVFDVCLFPINYFLRWIAPCKESCYYVYLSLRCRTLPLHSHRIAHFFGEKNKQKREISFLYEVNDESRISHHNDGKWFWALEMIKLLYFLSTEKAQSLKCAVKYNFPTYRTQWGVKWLTWWFTSKFLPVSCHMIHRPHYLYVISEIIFHVLPYNVLFLLFRERMLDVFVTVPRENKHLLEWQTRSVMQIYKERANCYETSWKNLSCKETR